MTDTPRCKPPPKLRGVNARDVLAAAVSDVDNEIAGSPKPRPTWQQFRDLDPETAAIYETRAGCYLVALRAAGLVVMPAEPTTAMIVAAIKRPDTSDNGNGLFYSAIYRAMISAAQEADGADA